MTAAVSPAILVCVTDRNQIAESLDTTRERTHRLFAPLSDDDVLRAPNPIMSPPVWDLGHIAAYEELWVDCVLAGRSPRYPDLQRAYDAFETPRATRTTIPLLDRAGCEKYLSDTRNSTLDVLACCDLEGGPRLARNGFVFDLVAQHEAQHTETVLQALQMFEDGSYRPDRAGADSPHDDAPAQRRITIRGERLMMGAAGPGFSYDCERPRHPVDVDDFSIDRLPVTNADWMSFIADGGYTTQTLWTEAGWSWRSANEVLGPLYWSRGDGQEWLARSFHTTSDVQPSHPVCHISYFEAQAFARWAGGRLPTEAEWELAAQGARVEDAHLDQLAFGTTAAGAKPLATSDAGCLDMLGNVWEWTSSPFGPYPGFVVDPYPEYAQVFFGGDYMVLRGGAWATQPIAARTSFRNWDHPYRRQIFAGMRMAWDR